MPNEFRVERFFKWISASILTTIEGRLTWPLCAIISILPLLLPLGLAQIVVAQGMTHALLGQMCAAVALGALPLAQTFFSLLLERTYGEGFPTIDHFGTALADMWLMRHRLLLVCFSWFLIGIVFFAIGGAYLSVKGMEWETASLHSALTLSSYGAAVIFCAFSMCCAILSQALFLSARTKKVFEPLILSAQAAFASPGASLLLGLSLSVWVVLFIAFPFWGVLSSVIPFLMVDLAIRDCWLPR